MPHLIRDVAGEERDSVLRRAIRLFDLLMVVRPEAGECRTSSDVRQEKNATAFFEEPSGSSTLVPATA
jgi:hypothetical protein